MLDRAPQTQPDIEGVLTDAMSDARVLKIVMGEACDSPRDDSSGSAKIVMDEDTFIAWMRACDHVIARVREVARVFYSEENP